MNGNLLIPLSSVDSGCGVVFFGAFFFSLNESNQPHGLKYSREFLLQCGNTVVAFDPGTVIPPEICGDLVEKSCVNIIRVVSGYSHACADFTSEVKVMTNQNMQYLRGAVNKKDKF